MLKPTSPPGWASVLLAIPLIALQVFNIYDPSSSMKDLELNKSAAQMIGESHLFIPVKLLHKTILGVYIFVMNLEHLTGRHSVPLNRDQYIRSPGCGAG